MDDQMLKWGFGALISYFVIKELFTLVKHLVTSKAVVEAKELLAERHKQLTAQHEKLCTNLDEISNTNKVTARIIDATYDKCNAIEKDTTIIKTKLYDFTK